MKVVISDEYRLNTTKKKIFETLDKIHKNHKPNKITFYFRDMFYLTNWKEYEDAIKIYLDMIYDYYLFRPVKYADDDIKVYIPFIKFKTGWRLRRKIKENKNKRNGKPIDKN